MSRQHRRGLTAGQRRALKALSARMARWRCPACLTDHRSPVVRADGVECPACGALSTDDLVVLHRVPTPAGYRWAATFLD